MHAAAGAIEVAGVAEGEEREPLSEFQMPLEVAVLSLCGVFFWQKGAEREKVLNLLPLMFREYLNN